MEPIFLVICGLVICEFAICGPKLFADLNLQQFCKAIPTFMHRRRIQYYVTYIFRFISNKSWDGGGRGGGVSLNRPIVGGGGGYKRGVKGTVSRDILLLVLFMNQFPPSPRVFH